MITDALDHWTLDVDLPDWLPVPSSPQDAEDWRSGAETVFGILWPSGDSADPQHASLDSLLEFAAAVAPISQLVACLALPGFGPLPVTVRLARVEAGSGELLDVIAATLGQSNAISPPIVEDLDGDLAGGIRLTRFDLDDDGGLWATVVCARRAHDVDVVTAWRTIHLELVELFSPSLEKLLGCIRFDQTPQQEVTSD